MSTMDVEVEARLLEQEHRVVRVVQNFFARRQWAADDPRYGACRKALIWLIFSPTMAAAAAGGGVALATLIVLSVQTKLLRDQNQYFQDQNRTLQAQIELQRTSHDAQRRTETIRLIYGKSDGIDGAANPDRSRAEAIVEFVVLDRIRLQSSVGGHRLVDLRKADMDALDLSSRDLSSVDLTGATLDKADFRSSTLDASIIASEKITDVLMSGARLHGATVQAAFPRRFVLTCADLTGAMVHVSDLRSTFFLGSDLRGVNFVGVESYDARAFVGANIAGAKMPDEMRKTLLSAGALEDPASDWKADPSSIACIKAGVMLPLLMMGDRLL
jgi:hypothetical protein